MFRKHFSPFLALRYLKPKRSFVSVITLISVLGVALGVMILVVVIAVFTGFGEKIKETIIGFEPHITVDANGILTDWPELVDKIKAVDGVTSVTPFVQGQVIMDYNGRRLAPVMRAIYPDEKEVARFQEITKEGEFELDIDTVVIGDELARGMGISVGDTILLYSPSEIDTLVEAINQAEGAQTEDERHKWFQVARDEVTVPTELTVTGIFDSGFYEFDANFVMTHLETGQVLYNLAGDVHGISVETVDAYQAAPIKDAILEAIGWQYRCLTWADRHQARLEAVLVERQVMWFILLFLMIVAGFCIMNTMITVTYQKRSEIGLLKAIGAPEGMIARLFLIQGVIVGIFGVIVGLLLAWLFIENRKEIIDFLGEVFHIKMFSEEVYGFPDGLPAVVTFRDVFWISVGAFISCALAALAPAIIAARLEPAKALRSE
ncbi:MAG: ABC transporter permease [Verrucomicrobiae bacterium]|nr:ABC transporter permease [Verrucomicrobiae bacterium]